MVLRPNKNLDKARTAQAEGKDERLEKYFGGLLKNFVQSRGRKNVERYPRDAVFDQIMASARGQRVMEVA